MAMTDNGNILGIGGEKLDRLSDLPINVIHQTQDHISIEDAARMSILSRTWRYIWASNPKLVFDTKFCTKRQSSNTIDIISAILFQHNGSVKTFLVDISAIHSSQHPVVDQWMLFLSVNGLMDLTIQDDNSGNAPYKLPSYVYDMGLESLALLNCIFRPPCSFRVFHKLKSLIFTRVSFELDVAATSSLLLPNLERLALRQCIGLRFLNIHAPKVAALCLYNCVIDTPKLSLFMNSEKMRFFAITSDEEVSINRQDNTMKLTDLLRSWPDLNHLVLSSSVLKMLSQNKKDSVEVDVNSFQVPDYRTQQLNNLQKMKINRFRGKRDELLFIKFILASAPLLQKAILLLDKNVDESQSLKISKELMKFPRASPKSEIIYEPWSIEQALLFLRC